MAKIIIASKNPVKIDSTREGFVKMFKNEIFEIEELSVESGVSNQPMSEEETLKGATNRVNNVSNLSPEADYWVGIEGGSKVVGEGMKTFAWVVIKSKNGVVSQGRTASFYLPKKLWLWLGWARNSERPMILYLNELILNKLTGQWEY